MAEQQYIYVAAPVVATPASYAGYTGYTQQGETTYVQMPAGATASAVQATPYGYQYETQTAYQPTQQTVLVQPGSQAEYAVSYAQQGGQTISYVQTQAGVQPTLVYGTQGQITTIQPATAAHLAAPTAGQPATATYIQHPQIGATGQFQYAAAPPQQQTGAQPQNAQYATAVQQAQQQVYAAAAGQPQTLTIVAQPGITYQTASGTQIQASPYGAQQPQAASYTIQPAIGQPQVYGQQQQIYGASPQAGVAIQSGFAAPQVPQQPQMFLTNPGTASMGGPPPQSQGAYQQRPQMIGASNGPMGMNQLQFNQQGGGPMKSQMHHHQQQHERRPYDNFNGQDHDMNGGGRSGGGNELVELHQFPDTIFIQGLPDDITEDALIQQFSSIGKLKIDTRNGKPRVMIVKDKATGRPRGEATVGFQDVTSVTMAIKLFNNKDLFGRKVRIEIASRRVSVNSQNQNQNGNRGPGANRIKPDDGIDWFCPNCDNQNFSWRTECNRCKNQRPENGLDVTVNPQMFRGGLIRSHGGMEPDRRMMGGPGRGMMPQNMVLPPNPNNFPRQRLMGPPGGPMPGPIRGRHMGQNRRLGRPY